MFGFKALRGLPNQKFRSALEPLPKILARTPLDLQPDARRAKKKTRAGPPRRMLNYSRRNPDNPAARSRPHPLAARTKNI